MYENKIVGTGTEHPEQLLANPNNWRIHPKGQQDALESLLDDVGWVQNIIVNQRTGHVVDGHMRAAVAISRNESEVPVVYVDLTHEEERKVLASLDPIGAMAVTDTDAINNLIKDLDLSDQLISTINQSMPEWNPTWGDVEKAANEFSPTDHFTLTLEIPFEEFDQVKSEVESFIQQWENVRMK
jgi:hypothetical protein